MATHVLSEQMVLDKTKAPSLGEVRHLNLWGVGLTDVSVVSKLANIQVLALAANSISSLKCFADCPTLEELYLRKNNVTHLKEIMYLKNLRRLHTLWLIDNPCAKHPHYREFALYCCPNLKQLDSVEVTAAERATAAKKMSTKTVEEIMGKAASSTSSSGAPAKVAAAPTGKETASSTPRTGRSTASASTSAAGGNVIEERNASGKTVLFTTVQAQRAMLTSIVSLLPELTVESLELLEREVHSRVEKQKQQATKLAQAEAAAAKK